MPRVRGVRGMLCPLVNERSSFDVQYRSWLLVADNLCSYSRTRCSEALTAMF